MDILSYLNKVTHSLYNAGIPNPRREAEMLVCQALGAERTALYRGSLPPDDSLPAKVEPLLMRRLAHEPMEYILGYCDFAGVRIKCRPPVLIPRPETELLVQMAADILAEMSPGRRMLDLGTGSGCIPLALLNRFPGLWAVGLEFHPVAVRLARENASSMPGLDPLRGDLEPLPFPDAAFDLITANLPYIPSRELPDLMIEVRDWESHLALDGGDDGLEVIRRALPEAARVLAPGGSLLLEIGHGQGAEMVEMLREDPTWAEASLMWDLAGLERIVWAVRA